MAFFKFRNKDRAAKQSAQVSAPVQSLEELRRLAKYRLVGAAVLVLIGVVGLPLLLDRQPRPIPVNTPIDIPDRDKVLPLVLPTPVVKPAPVATPVPTASKPLAAPAPTAAKEAAKEPVAVQSKVQPVAVAPVVSASANLPPTKAEVSSRAQAILEARSEPAKQAVTSAAPVKPVSEAAAGQRFIVQVGAFADNARAHEVRLKLEKAGLKTYAQVAETKDGKRIRVRVGPFTSKAEADRVAAKIKKLDLPVALLLL
ncbi:MAG: hypothetical protein AUJ20_04615 [Comamonadaceae bacterium CG1_02_60_18]|nr:MAG: hypothetical protein AUJ20_04615 [Comamonadaceae bacterium CG1_02_60_18]PIQ52690.1 MAG: hypothetical protein COW02_10010 [Comamonadaceae bacterium CG12_big_fil_rev_8_21_14_0_65_59_15]